MKPVKKNQELITEEQSSLRRGIDLQREYFKHANLNQNYDIMIKAIENIKTEISQKAKNRNKTPEIIRITNIINWYKDLPRQYTKATPLGNQTIYPPNIEQRISRNIQIAYEIIIELLGILGLI